MNSPDRAPSDQPTLEGALNEAGATLEEGVLITRPSNVDEIVEEASPGVVDAPMLRCSRQGLRVSGLAEKAA